MYKVQFGVYKVGNDDQNKVARARLEELVNVYGWKIFKLDFMHYEAGQDGGYVYGVWIEKNEPDGPVFIDEPSAVEVKRGRPAKVDA
jgi:hypothetical protein